MLCKPLLGLGRMLCARGLSEISPREGEVAVGQDMRCKDKRISLFMVIRCIICANNWSSRRQVPVDLWTQSL